MKVKVEYEGRFEDGAVFDSSKTHGKPLEFEIGAGQVIPGFEKAVKELEVGSETEITLKPEEAYGPRNEEAVKDVPKEQIPDSDKLTVGAMLMVGLPNGAQMPVKVVEVGETTVKIDLNHPMAGKTLIFKLKRLE